MKSAGFGLVIFILILFLIVSTNPSGQIEPVPTPTLSSTAIITNAFLSQSDFDLREIARNLYIPWSIVFTRPNRLLVSQRNGYIRQIVNHDLVGEPLIYFNEVADEGEGGLMGLTLHPDYNHNKYVYAMLSYWKDGNTWIKVERLVDQGDHLLRQDVVIDNIRAGFNHDGGRLHFGPDDKLYISTGESGKRNLAQELTSLEGKILRLNDDGSLPADNPWPNSPIYALGLRNSQGFDWHPSSHRLYAVDHGPSGFDGPEGGDEINAIQPGGNYGWPVVSHQASASGMISPLVTFTPAIAPSGTIFYDSTLFPNLTNHLLIAELRGSGILECIVDDNSSPQIISFQKIPGIEVGRIRDIAVSPGGIIYFATNNTDGRGTTRPGDDKIYALIPR